MTIGGDGESMVEENKTMEEDLHLPDTEPKAGSDDSDELDDEISKLEQSMVEEDEDTDEDQNQESSGFGHPTKQRSLSRGNSIENSGTSTSGNSRQTGSQLIPQTEEDVEDTIVEDETFEIENDGIDFGAESSRKSLAKKKSDSGDIEMQTIKKQSSGSRSTPLDMVEICQ